MTRPQLLLIGLLLTLGLSAWLAVSPPATESDLQATAPPRRAAPALPQRPLAAANEAGSPGAEPAAAAALANGIGSLPHASASAWTPPVASALQAWGLAPPRPRLARAGPAAPPAVVAPSPPAFNWIGAMQDERGPLAWVSLAGAVLELRTGSKLTNEWQVQRLDASQLTLLHLPTGTSAAVALAK